MDADSVSSPRRSGRKCVSTTMQIQGHTVLRKNNYKVVGDTYVYDHLEEDEDAPKRAKKKPKKSSSSDTSGRQQKVRIENPATVKRKQHNKFVEDSVSRKSKLRRSFLADRLDLLRPFLEDAVVDKLLIDARANANANSNGNGKETKKVAVKQPKMIEKAILRPYQLKGLEFMVRMHEQNLAMILGDEMGLGKTLQSISLLCHLKEQEKVTGPSLIVCPLSVLSSWCNEMKQWAPTLRFFMMHASNAEEQANQRRHLLEHGTEYDVILTTYEMAKAPGLLNFYHRTKFHYLILDEGHKIKCHGTQVSMATRKIHAGNRLLLTGTPLQNNLVELWSLLNFLYPDIFTICDPFEKHFDLKENIIDKVFLAKAQKMLELFMLRRLKQEVEKLIPEKLETKVYCPLSKVQTFWYKSLLMKDVDHLSKIDSMEGTKSLNFVLLKSLFMQLRKCSNHPFLFANSETNPDETSMEDLIGASGKLSVLDMLLRSLFQKGHRAVLFSQFTMVLDIIEDYCDLRGWKYCRLDGSVDRAKRNYLIRRFNEPNSEKFLFLMSTRSGGMGLNLQTADTCILYDSDWNPQSDIQAMARVHRIGQKKTVHVYRLITAGTVEERMLERAEKKLLLEMVNQESKHSNNASMDPDIDIDTAVRGLSAGELWEDIKFGCEAVFGNSSNNELPSEDDIATITNRSRKESDSVGKLTGGTSHSAKSFDITKEYSNSQMFGGANFREIRNQQEKEDRKKIPKNLQGIAHLWKDIKNLDKKKRERMSRITLLEGKGSGYGMAYVPVLTANNYTFGGEESVFERELKQSKKANFEVKKKKKGPLFEHTDSCVICGDGGQLVCCNFCPNTVHLSCVGLTNGNSFVSCPHHRCSKCSKSKHHAGGVLYPCHACANSFCEDCLPNEGVTFLERVERFEELGFDSTKGNVYINCSMQCEIYAKAEFGYIPPKPNTKSRRASTCPKPIDLTGHFGASYEISEATAALDADKAVATGVGKRAPRKNYSLGREPKTATATVATSAKPCCSDFKSPQPQQLDCSKSNDTPLTSATDACSDTSSYYSGSDGIAPTPDLSGNDADHAIALD